MTTTLQAYVGIDIAKDKFDAAVLGQVLVKEVANTNPAAYPMGTMSALVSC